MAPLKDQKSLLGEIISHWTHGAGGRSNPHRSTAFRTLVPADSVDDAVAHITKKCGQTPYLLASSAQGPGDISFRQVNKMLERRPVLLLLGTSQGLSPVILRKCNGTLPPLRYADSYNHLSVRMAGAILIDRILGDLD